MRILFIVCVVLVAYTQADVLSLDFTLCSECECKTPQNSSDPVLLVAHSEHSCYCFCGKLRSDACSVTGECHSGLYCTAPDGETRKGICDDACNRPDMKCGTYEKCEVVNDKPTCICTIFDCSADIIRPLCAVGNKEFKNRCFYENDSCEQKRENLPGHVLQGHGDCLDVVSRLNSNTANTGNSYNPFA